MSANSLVRPGTPPPTPLRVLSTDTTLDVSDNGKAFGIDSSGNAVEITLPPCRDEDIGTTFHFILTAGGSNVIFAPSSGFVLGSLVTQVNNGPLEIGNVGPGIIDSVTISAALSFWLELTMVAGDHWAISGTARYQAAP